MGIEKINCTDSKIETLKKLNKFADEIETKLNADLDNLSTAGQAKFDEKVNVSDMVEAPFYQKSEVYTKTEADNRYVNATGDTLSGNLIVAKDQGTYNIKEPNLDYTSNPTSQHVSAFRCLDKNSKILGDIRFVSDTDGTQTTSIFARHARTGSEKNATLSVILDKNGNDRVATNNLSVTNATVSNGRLIVNNTTATTSIHVNTAEVNKGTIHSQNTAYDNTSTTAPSAHIYIQKYRSFDKNGKEVGCYEVVHDTSNNVRSIIRTSRIISGATKTANFNIGVRANGNRYAHFDIDEFIINGKHALDGQWVAKSYKMVENYTLDLTKDEPNQIKELTYDLSNYLPKDGYNYDVKISLDIKTANNASSYISATVGGTGTANNAKIYARAIGVVTHTSYFGIDNSSVDIPIGQDRKLYFQYASLNYQPTIVLLALEGYRRIGINV